MGTQKQQKVVESLKKQKNTSTQSAPQTQQKIISRDRAKLNSFYDFKIDNKKLDVIKQRTFKSQRKVFLIGIAFGFFTQYLLGNTRIYENIVRKATMRRLNAKKKEEDIKEQKYQKKLEKQKGQSQSKAGTVV